MDRRQQDIVVFEHDFVSIHEVGFCIGTCLRLRLRAGNNRLSNASLLPKWASYRLWFWSLMPVRIHFPSCLLRYVSRCARLWRACRCIVSHINFLYATGFHSSLPPGSSPVWSAIHHLVSSSSVLARALRLRTGRYPHHLRPPYARARKTLHLTDSVKDLNASMIYTLHSAGTTTCHVRLFMPSPHFLSSSLSSCLWSGLS